MECVAVGVLSPSASPSSSHQSHSQLEQPLPEQQGGAPAAEIGGAAVRDQYASMDTAARTVPAASPNNQDMEVAGVYISCLSKCLRAKTALGRIPQATTQLGSVILLCITSLIRL